MVINELTVEQLEIAANMLKAIAHPTRIAILNFLEDGKKKTVTEIHEKLQIEQSTASHHLGILRDRGVLVATRDGKNSFYSIKHNKLSKLIECINSCACN
ncbi:MAG: helix-turn-helix transcriptional regulator [Bacteroidales bacterium]|nr:helix-turn-helix transcriptional regulator [Bacteroidales bacterium]